MSPVARWLLKALLPAAHRLRLLYWRLARPRTHGVRVVIRQRGTGAVLLVRHTYGARERWFPPGGGHAPARESAEDAGRREVREEVGVALGALTEIGRYRTGAGGNRDDVRLFLAETDAPAGPLSAEIAECRWVGPADLATGLALAGVTRHALGLLAEFADRTA